MADTAPEHPIACQETEPRDFCNTDVHSWFDLTYSSYLVLPRSLMQEMPAAWQHAVVALLERMHEEFPEEHSSYTVMKKGERNRFEKDPLRAYRYPDRRAIDAARGVVVMHSTPSFPGFDHAAGSEPEACHVCRVTAELVR